MEKRQIYKIDDSGCSEHLIYSTDYSTAFNYYYNEIADDKENIEYLSLSIYDGETGDLLDDIVPNKDYSIYLSSE